jgi:adenylate cyclase
VWTEDLVEVIEGEVEAAGVLVRPERVPAMCFLDLAGYTRLTEERGDQAAAELAGTLGSWSATPPASTAGCRSSGWATR